MRKLHLKSPASVVANYFRRRRIMRDLEGPLTVMPPSNSEA